MLELFGKKAEEALVLPAPMQHDRIITYYNIEVDDRLAVAQRMAMQAAENGQNAIIFVAS